VRTPGKLAEAVLLCLAWVVVGHAAEQPAVPELLRAALVALGPLEVDAGEQWSQGVSVPRLSDDERPVLALSAYARAGGGCNNVLQVFVDGMPLSESPLRRRLLNKLPWFDPPGTEYHFPGTTPGSADG